VGVQLQPGQRAVLGEVVLQCALHTLVVAGTNVLEGGRGELAYSSSPASAPSSAKWYSSALSTPLWSLAPMF
ncbi:hypothetical protein C7E25_24930, partial [Stenotrophomonas maltophilia]